MRINIVGSAPGWEDCPVNDGYIWGVNNMHLLMDLDRIVDIHVSRLNLQETKDRIHFDELKEKDIEAYLHSEFGDMPNVKRYPIEEIRKEFNGIDYFGSGIDYIIALAIYEGATEIHIYGVYMKGGSEYAHQKPSVEFWLGVCVGRDIHIEVHGLTTLLRTHNGLMYGYQTPQKWVKKDFPNHISLQELMDRYEDDEKGEQ
jgi:hypothetical protein